MTFVVRSDRQLIRTVHRSQRYVVAELTAPAARADRPRPSAHLAFVLDRSGSMTGKKLELVKEAVRQAIDRLALADRFAVVVYDEHVDIVSESRAASPAARREALDALGRIEARGTTALAGGWLRGAEQVALHLEESGVNRVLLLTDGLANVGVTDPDELTRHAAELRARGVATSTFGVGEDFDERLLSGMADAGGGSFRFIENAGQIPDHITSEVGELLEVTARDVVLEVTAPDGVGVEPIAPFSCEASGNRTLIRLGDLVADQRVRLPVRLTFSYGEPGRGIAAHFELTDRDGAVAEPGPTLMWRYADDRENDLQSRDRIVDRVVARAFADRALQGAVDRNRRGEYLGARETLRETAERIAGYAGDDPELRAVVAELERAGERWSVSQGELSRKLAYAASAYAMKSRDMHGRATRGPRS